MTRVSVSTPEGMLLGDDIHIADNAWRRFIGLMGTRDLPIGSGLIFPRTNAVHGFFMRYPIRLVYLDRKKIVVRVAVLAPWHVGPWVPRAFYVLELPMAVPEEYLKLGGEIRWSES